MKHREENSVNNNNCDSLMLTYEFIASFLSFASYVVDSLRRNLLPMSLEQELAFKIYAKYWDIKPFSKIGNSVE